MDTFKLSNSSFIPILIISSQRELVILLRPLFSEPKIMTTFFGKFVSLTVTQWLVVFAITLFGVFSYLMLVLATRRGDISVISPFRYTRLVFALILAMLILDERPDILTLMGAAIIVASGYYTIWREKVLGT